MDIEYFSPSASKRHCPYITPDGKSTYLDKSRLSLLQNAAKIKKKYSNHLDDKENICKKLFEEEDINFEKLSKKNQNKEKISKQALKHLQLFISEFNLKSLRLLEFFSDDSLFEVMGVNVFSPLNALKVTNNIIMFNQILNSQNLKFEVKDNDYIICESQIQNERIITINKGLLQSNLTPEFVSFVLSAKINADEILENCKITYIKIKLQSENFI